MKRIISFFLIIIAIPSISLADDCTSSIVSFSNVPNFAAFFNVMHNASVTEICDSSSSGDNTVMTYLQGQRKQLTCVLCGPDPTDGNHPFKKGPVGPTDAADRPYNPDGSRVPNFDDELDDFHMDGKTRDQNGNPSTDVPPGALPLDPIGCQGIGGVSHLKCTAQGQDGNNYTTHVPLPSSFDGSDDVSGMIDNARDSGINAWDQRDLNNENHVNKGPSETVRVEDWGTAITTSDGNVHLNFNSANNDALPFTTSQDMKDKIINNNSNASTATGYGGMQSGSSSRVNSALQGMADIASSSAGVATGSDLAFEVKTNADGSQQIVGYNAVTGVVVGAVTISPDGALNNDELNEVRSNANASGVGPAGTNVVNAGSFGAPSNGSNVGGDGSSAGAGLPGDPAAEAGDGIGNNGAKDGGQFGTGDYISTLAKDCEEIDCVVDPYLNTIQQTSFVSFLNSLVPASGSGSLPQFCLDFGSYGNNCFNLSDWAIIFDVMGAFVLIYAAWISIKIIIVREAT